MQGLLGELIAVVGVGLVFGDQLSADVPVISLLLIPLAAVVIPGGLALPAGCRVVRVSVPWAS